MGFRRVPKRVIIQGNDILARSHIGEADSLLNLCETQAGFQGLQQFQMVRNLEDGSVITARICSGVGEVTINSPFIPDEPEPKEDVKTFAPGNFWFYVRTNTNSFPGNTNYQYFYFRYTKGGGFDFKKNFVFHESGGGGGIPGVIQRPSRAKLFYVSKEMLVEMHNLDTPEGRDRYQLTEFQVNNLTPIFYWVASINTADEPVGTSMSFSLYRGLAYLSVLATSENFIYNFPYLLFHGESGLRGWKIRCIPPGAWIFPESGALTDWAPMSYNALELDTSTVPDVEEEFNVHIVTQARIFNGGFCIYPSENAEEGTTFDPWKWKIENLDDLTHLTGTSLIQNNVKTVTENDTITWNWPNFPPGTVGYRFDLGFDPTIVMNKFYPVRLHVQDNMNDLPLTDYGQTTYSIEMEARARTSPTGADLVFLQLAGRWTGDIFHTYRHYQDFDTNINCGYNPETNTWEARGTESTFIMHRGFAAEGIVFAKFIGDAKWLGANNTFLHTTFTLPGFSLGDVSRSFYGLWRPEESVKGPDVKMIAEGTNAGIHTEIGPGGTPSGPPSSSFEVVGQVVDARLDMPGDKTFYIDWKFSGKLEMTAANPHGTPISQNIIPTTTTERFNAAWPMGSAIVGDILVFSSEVNTVLEGLKALVNEKRVEDGAAPLDWEWRLDDICVRHASDVWKTEGAADHDGWEDREGRAKAAYPGLNTFGENVAWRSDLDAEGIIQQWWDSPGHKENMLRPEFTLGGMAVRVGPWGHDGMSVGVCNIFLGSTP